MMKGIGAGVATVLALLLVAALGVAAWQFGWFVAEKDTDRQVNIDNRNKGTQVAWRDEARDAIRDMKRTDDPAYDGVLRDQACSLIARLTPAYQDADLLAFQSRECR